MSRPPEPEEGDYAISPTGHLGCRSTLSIVGGRSTGDYSTDDEALAAAQSHMKSEQFWPNVWRVSDHGNWSLIEG